MRILFFVGATGFEPAAAWSQTRSATGLRYTPLQRLGKNIPFCGCKGSYFFRASQIFLSLFYDTKLSEYL